MLGVWAFGTSSTPPNKFLQSTATAQDAFNRGLYTILVRGGTYEQFVSEYQLVANSSPGPNLFILFNCKWMAYALGNGFFYTANNIEPPSLISVPDPAYYDVDEWMELHMKPAYWMAVQASRVDPYAIDNYENAVAAIAAIKTHER